MFNLLSSQTKLLTLLSQYPINELQVVCDNLKLITRLLNLNATELLANRRDYGVLLPQEDTINISIKKEKPALPCNELLLDKRSLTKVINSFCLTEAILVRNNFSNCLDFITEQNIATQTIPVAKPANFDKTTDIEKSNVSPIRLTAIKQRLANAIQNPTEKQAQVKNKLNSLLDTPRVIIPKKSSKQA